MTTHVNIAEAKARLSELVSAAVRGEDVVLDRAGVPQARLVAVAAAGEAAKLRRMANRQAAFGLYAHLVGDRLIDVRALKLSDDEQAAEHRRKFGTAD